MKFKLNNSPHLRMHEITKKLFNRNFLSDVQFILDGKIIFAHSLELMKRSVVFEEQLEDTWGEKKLIPIVDCKYENFLEFMRFIYTDECDINIGNGIELLKLATRYKVIMLENHVINTMTGFEWIANLFGYCVTEKYEIARYQINHLFSFNFHKILNQNNGAQFLSLHPDAVCTALQLEDPNDVTETQMFNAVAKWIENYCGHHQMTLAEGRQQFDHLIKNIRFPTMSSDEIRDCARKYPELLNENDYMTIGKQVLFGGESGNDNVWISKLRCEWNEIYEWRKVKREPDTIFKTKFTVAKDTILHGLWIGVEVVRKDIEIEIITKNTTTNVREKIQFIQSAPGHWCCMLISLGESLCVKPNFEYTITIKYLGITEEYINILCRPRHVDVICNNPENSIQNLKASDNILRMIFKSATS